MCKNKVRCHQLTKCCDQSLTLCFPQEPQFRAVTFNIAAVHTKAGLAPLAMVGGLSDCVLLLPVHDLRQQMAALQSQLQQVQLERTTLTSKLKASQAEISSLQSVRQWYQQQLALAQEARVRLQGEMAHIQVRPDGRAHHTPHL